MNTITYLKGDATRPIETPHQFRIIAHIVNNQGAWGKGFTYSLNKRWVKPQAQYREWAAQHRYQQVSMLGKVQFVAVATHLYVANMCAQQGISYTGQRVVCYPHLAECLREMATRLNDTCSIHMPRIGAGLGGGDWQKIEQIIEDTLCVAGIPVYVYDL